MAQRTIGLFPAVGCRTLAFLLLGALITTQGGSAGATMDDPRIKLRARVLESASSGAATVWVFMREKANVGAAAGIKDDLERGTYVYRKLRDVAFRSQAALRATLGERGVAYKPFWIVNAIRLAADHALLLELAAREDVKAIYPDRALSLEAPQRGRQEPRVATVEWNIVRIRAPKVWSQYDDRGEGIVVANIDTGVQFDHPALVRQYRGNLGSGSFDHNFNWADPSGACPSRAPCDNVSHGTHTMGVMVGDDGMPGPNQIGVAPNATWIACKGCEGVSCSLEALTACGQWMLAPTDLAGNNPSPALRPHVVNNSWGSPGGDPFYSQIVDAWVASGIFPQFGSGSSGPGCGTFGSPGDYVASYSSSAFDMQNRIATFSSRGPSPFGPGEIKPNIASPGVNIRSSVSIPPGGYAVFTGTSMAQPHVAGTVALIWSRSMTVRRDIPVTRRLLDRFAKNMTDLSCGGTAGDNNVWGEGMLNALGSTAAAPLP
jgi:subtilisin family serine protease